MKEFNLSSVLKIVLICLPMILASCNSRELEPKDWEPTYENRSTLPYGTFITYHTLDSIFSDKDIYATRESIYDEVYDLLDYEFFQSKYNEATDKYEQVEIMIDDRFLTNLYGEKRLEDTYAYIFIANRFVIDETDEEALCDFVGTGNNVFISAETVSKSFLKRLSLRSEDKPISRDSIFTLTEYPDKKYTFPPLWSRITYKSGAKTCYFDLNNISLPYQVLGTDIDNKPRFIKIKYGFGYFYLHTAPRAFANISMLDLDKYDYGFRCLSYLGEDDLIYWDESIKSTDYGDQERSLFKVIFKNEALTWGFIILIIGLLLYMLFRGKRTQRVIPVIKLPENTSLAYLDTLSNMFYKKQDYVAGVKNRHAFFLEYVRKHYYMDTEKVDDKFLQVLSAKSNVSPHIIKNIFKDYNNIKDKNRISVDTFMKYNSSLERFYNTAKNKE